MKTSETIIEYEGRAGLWLKSAFMEKGDVVRRLLIKKHGIPKHESGSNEWFVKLEPGNHYRIVNPNFEETCLLIRDRNKKGLRCKQT